jgi:hypothetical protein
MADIQVNSHKSLFITDNNSNYNISFLNCNIPRIPKNQPFKFLGCWFTLDNKISKQIQLIQEEVFQLVNIASTKKITDKQIIYVINTVIIPTLEYRIHNIVLPRTTCAKILAKYLTVAKHKANLSRSIPNSTMLNHHLYNIHNIWDIQLQHHITNFLHRINDPSILGTTTHIRLQQLQNNLWSTTNILQHSQPIIDGPNKYTTNFKIIQLLTHLNMQITANQEIIWPKTISNAHQPIEPILIQHPQYIQFKKQLRHHKILYLEQLCTADNSTLLCWQDLSPRLHQIPKGRQPLWFSYLEDKVTSHGLYRTLLPHYQSPGINPFAYNIDYFPKKLKPWLLTYQDNNIIIGKIRKYLDDKIVSISH